MKEVQSFNNDEVNLFKFFYILWREKILLIFIIFISLILSWVYVLNIDSKYQSSINFSIQNLPPDINEQQALTEFKKLLFSKQTFNFWKQKNTPSNISFKDFSPTKFLDGFEFSKKTEDNILEFKTNRVSSNNELVSSASILVKTNDYKKIKEFHSYINHVSNYFEEKYVLSATKEVISRKKTLLKLTDFSNSSVFLFDKHTLLISKLENYIESTSRQSGLLNIQYPSQPQKTYPKETLIIIFGTIFGGIIGSVFLIIRNAYRDHKEKNSDK